MGYLVQVGAAVEVRPGYSDGPYVRPYRKDGRTFIGYDTDENVYLCSDECLDKFLAGWRATDNNANAYVRNEHRVDGGVLDIETADVVPVGPEELDVPEHCGVCEDLVEVPLSPDGYRYVAERVEELLSRHAGRPEIIEQWVDAYPDAKDDFRETRYFADAFTAYVECALWSSIYDANEDGTPADHETGNMVPFDDHFGEDDIADEAKDEMRDDLLSFIWSNVTDLVGLAPQQVGQDFWLSRNGHGAGFFDLGLGQRGHRLQAAATRYGTQELCVGDDGKVYVQ